MTAFVTPCLCGEPMVPFVQKGAVVKAKSLGRVPGILFVCPSCGHISAFPQPNKEELADLSNKLYRCADQNEGDEFSRQEIQLSYKGGGGKKHVPKMILALLQKAFGTQEVKLFDFGCGAGDLVHNLRNAGVEATGSDWDGDAIAIAHDMGNRHVLQSEGFPDTSQKYDAILLHHVLEHVSEPGPLMKEIFDQLAPGGLVIVVLPNGGYLLGRLSNFNAVGWNSALGHVHAFTGKSLDVLLTDTGFEHFEVRGTDIEIRSLKALPEDAPAPESVASMLASVFPSGQGLLTCGKARAYFEQMAARALTIEIVASARKPLG